ncbi:hypothetical protein [Hymenobacter terrenus]|nr:hypothetical protein [Hymenobacter terrenus]
MAAALACGPGRAPRRLPAPPPAETHAPDLWRGFASLRDHRAFLLLFK